MGERRSTEYDNTVWWMQVALMEGKRAGLMSTLVFDEEKHILVLFRTP